MTLPPSTRPAQVSTSLPYLPHLDGLRAVALLGVLLFHFDVPIFRGGYAGVDVFLTLSGYLITRNNLPLLSTHTFSLYAFYTSRFRRLYPAAAATILPTLLLSYLLFPNALALSVAQSALCSAFFTANVYFHMQSGYFDTSANLKPLLHMWSLSLEEQFYLLWAPLLLLSSRFFNNVASIRTACIILFVASLLVAAVVSTQYPSFAFYHLPTRIFQFAAGAILATHQHTSIQTTTTTPTTNSDIIHNQSKPSKPPPIPPTQNVVSLYALPTLFQNFLSVLSLVTLLLTYTLLPPAAPPHHLLPATLATATLIALPSAKPSTALLSLAPARWLGRTSYAAYLTHWPLYVFLRYAARAVNARPPPAPPLLALTLLAAAALRACVEVPLRRAGGARGRLAVALLVGGAVALSAAGVATAGFKFRSSGSDALLVQKALRKRGLPPSRHDLCGDEAPIIPGRSRRCRVGPANTHTIWGNKTLFIGNSFLGHWLPALHVIAHRRNITLRAMIAPSCVLHPRRRRRDVENEHARRCRDVHDAWWRAIDGLPRGAVVVAGFLWQFRGVWEVSRRFGEILDEFGERGLRLVVVGEPPGLSPSVLRFFDCKDMLRQPGGRLWWWWWRRSVHGQRANDADGIDVRTARRMCGMDIVGRGALPAEGRRESSGWYSLVLRGNGNESTFTTNEAVWRRRRKNVRLVNMFDLLCTRADGNGTMSEEGKFLCRMPLGKTISAPVFDPGYLRDGRHLSMYGAYSLTETVEEALFVGVLDKWVNVSQLSDGDRVRRRTRTGTRTKS